MYVYIESEHGLYTVGFYDPKGGWQSESDHDNTLDAAERVAWLNGNKATQFDRDFNQALNEGDGSYRP